ncbi:acyl-CoA dehydrogenase [Salmonella enterica subsp. arizonae]|uniref:Acyl-CoA dehydrogenase n=1 Tax=Salmonella enterica subsp. arizonae TaxID=59203 RepID=A0A379TF01_SALER|nr:acyl-CoA dehydrogenase [Salmonella enterica subsp. arizonae]
MKSIEKDKNQDIRDAVRSLCSEFDDKYHRRIDETKKLS